MYSSAMRWSDSIRALFVSCYRVLGAGLSTGILYQLSDTDLSIQKQFTLTNTYTIGSLLISENSGLWIGGKILSPFGVAFIMKTSQSLEENDQPWITLNAEADTIGAYAGTAAVSLSTSFFSDWKDISPDGTDDFELGP